MLAATLVSEELPDAPAARAFVSRILAQIVDRPALLLDRLSSTSVSAADILTLSSFISSLSVATAFHEERVDASTGGSAPSRRGSAGFAPDRRGLHAATSVGFEFLAAARRGSARTLGAIADAAGARSRERHFLGFALEAVSAGSGGCAGGCVAKGAAEWSHVAADPFPTPTPSNLRLAAALMTGAAADRGSVATWRLIGAIAKADDALELLHASIRWVMT
jgi:hypothetical protein